MIGAALVEYVDQTERVAKAARKAIYRNVAHAAASIRKTSIESIEPARGPSEPGTPPHTHTQRRTKKGKVRQGHLPRAIVFKAEKEEAVIGPRFSVVGESGSAQEFGGEYKDQEYPERPFMGPALDDNLDRFASSFTGSIGE